MTTTAHEDQFTPAPVEVADLGPWECFQDSSYYDMWCVRRVHDRTFGIGFHLVNGDEAARLRDHLNTRTASAPAGEVEPVAMQRTIDRLHRELSDLRTKYVDALAAHTPAPADLVEALRWALAEIEGRTRYTDPQQRQNCLDKCEMALAKHGGA